MLYAILCEDHPGSLERRKSTRAAHLARLKALQDQGRLVLAGPYPAIDCDDPGEAGFTGSLIVAEFPSLEEATRWAEDDPYRHAGVYALVTVKPFRKVLPR
ncbi:MAG TPA: YciI family protein [Methylococcus sp.]|nr:YciI family protein [Methylococcus sp.]